MGLGDKIRNIISRVYTPPALKENVQASGKAPLLSPVIIQNATREFESLNREFSSPKAKENLIKWKSCNRRNRFPDMPNYGHNVPNWSPAEKNCVEYLNSNFVEYKDADTSSPKFIAMQAPTPTNMPSFAHLLMKIFIPIIVTIIHRDEGWESHTPYWSRELPSLGNSNYSIRPRTSNCTEGFSVKGSIQVSYMNKKLRWVNHFHVHAWTDNEAPERKYWTSLIGIYDEILKKNNKFASIPRSPSFIVHCSAGIGRTGTFIAGIILYEKFLVARSKKVTSEYSISSIVRSLREMRYGSVATLGQYLFLYDFANYLAEGYTWSDQTPNLSLPSRA